MRRSTILAGSIEARTLLGLVLAAAWYAPAAGQEFGRALGKSAHSPASQPHSAATHSDPQAHHRLHGATPDFNFHHPLQREIDLLKADAKPVAPATDYNRDQYPSGKKAMLLDNAVQHYRSLFKEESHMTAHELASPGDYTIGEKRSPHYFAEGIDETHKTVVRRVPDDDKPYTYNVAYDPERVQFWVDFANMKLGGGVFGHGSFQEETMFLEVPELANAAALHTINTRTGVDPGVLQGSPTPWAFMNVRRVMAIDQKALKHDAWKSMHHDALDAADVRLDKPLTINVLSIAAPMLTKGTPQASPPVVRDLFNSFVAGFTLARQACQAKKGEAILINTGPIGAGGFNNDAKVVYVLQNLAARKVGDVVLKLWMYDQKTVHDADQYDIEPIMADYAKLSAQHKTIEKLLEIASLRMGGHHSVAHH